MTSHNAGKITTAAELEAAGFVAAPEERPQPPAIVSQRRNGYTGPKKWPSYARCVDHAPPALRRDDHPDRSRADFVWCMTALDWGWSQDDTAAQLMEESPKAREKGREHAELTARNAAAAIARRRGGLKTPCEPQ